jgi:tetratricopeptide (TPR) repeat protein
MHSDYASSLNNIGNTYDSKGDYDKALEHYSKSAEIRKIVLG